MTLSPACLYGTDNFACASLQTNPFVNKNLFQQEAIVALKQAGKSFPINNDIGILRWLHQTSDDSFIPLSSKQ